jgi:transcription elongation factor Elf1
MTHCTRCGLKAATMKVEDVDGVYEIYSWTCESCGQHVEMAMGHAEAFQLPDYCLTFDDVLPAHVAARKPAPARRPVAA